MYEFSDELVVRVCRSKCFHFAEMGSDFNAQIGKLFASESCMGGLYALSVQRTNNEDGLR